MNWIRLLKANDLEDLPAVSNEVTGKMAQHMFNQMFNAAVPLGLGKAGQHLLLRRNGYSPVAQR
jgi:hypothetical protein